VLLSKNKKKSIINTVAVA